MLFLNDKQIEFIKFNGGEVQVNLSNFQLHEIHNQEICIKAIIKNSDDIVALIQTKKIIDRHNPKEVILYLPRVPYAQSDRAMTQHECSGLKIFAKLINDLNFKKVCVDDPHSDVTEALFDNILIRQQYECLSRLKDKIKEFNHDFLISPDGGALKKIYSSSKLLQLPVVEASKHRDVVTGKLSNPSVNANNVNLEDTTVLIIDDLIDGGGTFIQLAKTLKEDYKVKTVNLYITHGLFSKGFDLPFIDNYFVFHLWDKQIEIPNNIFYRSLF